MPERPKISDDPADRLTFICSQMTAVLNVHDRRDVKAIVFLSDAERGGIQVHGYDDMTEAMAELLTHLQAMFEAQGKRLDFVSLHDDGITRIEGQDYDE